mmetsp:Transcript_713/g.1077  ORF Transcript_713/g.1077 Transcript_713/m.1077 type:complete len:85 (-) Transcript_713:211-465(-)
MTTRARVKASQGIGKSDRVAGTHQRNGDRVATYQRRRSTQRDPPPMMVGTVKGPRQQRRSQRGREIPRGPATGEYHDRESEPAR